MLEATKVSSTGHLYFIPRQHMDKVDTFETFIEQLSAINQNDNALSVNNFYIIDDAKQRDKMTEEFYSAVDVYKRQIQQRPKDAAEAGGEPRAGRNGTGAGGAAHIAVIQPPAGTAHQWQGNGAQNSRQPTALLP